MSGRVWIRGGGKINLISEAAITKTIMAGDLTNRKFVDYEKERAKNRTLGDTLTGVSCFSVEMKYYLPGGSKPGENCADMAVSQEKCKLRPKKWNFG